jgi:hypothetical protein
MNHQKATHKRAAHPIKERLSKDVHFILASCLHQFEEVNEIGDEKHFNVDAVLRGAVHGARQHRERRTGRVDHAVRREYAGTLPRGAFIPHENLFNAVVRAHS